MITDRDSCIRRACQKMAGGKRHGDFLYHCEQTEQLPGSKNQLIPATLRLIDGLHYLLLPQGKEP